MTSLTFGVLDIQPEAYAVAPNLIARLQVEVVGGGSVHALLLRCQVRIAVHRRPYSAAEEAGLVDLFGGRARWVDSLKPFSWIHTTATVPGFTDVTEVDLVLPCTYDVEVAGTRYLHALRDGAIPLELLFSGTVFARTSTGYEVTQIPWDTEAGYDLPVATWRALMDQYFPNAGWLRLDRDTLDALGRFKSARGITSWDQTLTTLLSEAGQVTR